MSNPVFQAPPAAAVQEPSQQQAQPPAAAVQGGEPPWGNDFDPARAWHTIQALREQEKELERLKKQPVMTDEQQQQLSEYNRLVEASKSNEQRLQEAATQSQKEAESARAEAFRWQAAATHGIPAEHFDLLGTGSADEIKARAEKLGALLAAQAAANSTPPAPGAPPSRPVEQLRPGATPGQAVDEEELLMQSLFGAPK